MCFVNAVWMYSLSNVHFAFSFHEHYPCLQKLIQHHAPLRIPGATDVRGHYEPVVCEQALEHRAEQTRGNEQKATCRRPV